MIELESQRRPPHNMRCKRCSRRTVYPEKAFGEWFYPSERTRFLV